MCEEASKKSPIPKKSSTVPGQILKFLDPPQPYELNI